MPLSLAEETVTTSKSTKSTAAGGLKRKNAESQLPKKTLGADGPVNKKSSPLKELPEPKQTTPADTLQMLGIEVDEIGASTVETKTKTNNPPFYDHETDLMDEDVYNDSNNEEVLRATVDAADKSTAVRPYSYSIPVVDNAGHMFTVTKYNGSSSFVMFRDDTLTFVTNQRSYMIPDDLVRMKLNAPLTPSTHADSGVGCSSDFVGCPSDFESKIDKLVKDVNFMKHQSELLATYGKKSRYYKGQLTPQVLTIDDSASEEEEEGINIGVIESYNLPLTTVEQFLNFNNGMDEKNNTVSISVFFTEYSEI